MKLKLYLGPLILLLGVLTIIFVIFIGWSKVDSIETRITGIITAFGVGFTLFQFWVAEINKNRRQDYELRYNEYLRAQKILDAIPNTLNEEMARKEMANPHGVYSKLMNLINQFKSFVNNHNDHLFPGLKDKEVTKQVNKILGEIMEKTDSFKTEIEKYENRKEDGAN